MTSIDEHAKDVLINYGLKFTPVPASNLIELRADIRKFCRKLKLKEFFAGKETHNDKSLVKPKSVFSPQRNRDAIPDTYIDFLVKYPLEEKRDQLSRVPNNLNKNQWNGISKLKNNRNLVIKGSDKGGACVIMDSAFYKSKILNILNEQETYKKLDKNIDNIILRKIKKLTDKYSDVLTDNETKYLNDSNHQTSQLYGLPKIHKSKIINDNIKRTNTEYLDVNRPNGLTFRPIIAGPRCVTSKLSNFLDIILKEYITHIPSYIRDDIHFLEKIERDISETEIMLSFDVTSMYTNIDNALGIEAITYWLDTYPGNLPRDFPKQLVTEGLSLVLENNTFIFDNQNYIQIRGTAMGTKVAPTYATMVMGYLETKLYQKIQEKYGAAIKDQFIKRWHRYLDDCFLIWDTSIDSTDNLLNILQTLHEKIKFTVEKSNQEINFLDIKIIAKNNKITTDIYQKPTDSEQYVHFYSCHPSHTKRNIPFNLARRACTIIESEESKTQKMIKLKEVLSRQGYPKNLIDNGIKKAAEIPLAELRKAKAKNNEKDVLAFVTTHNPRNPDMYKVIKDTINVLDASPKLKKVLSETTLINSKRQPPNLKQILTRARFVSLQQSEQPNIGNGTKVRKCNNPRCGTCPLLIEASEIKLKSCTAPFQIRSEMDCTATDLIYLIKCSGCDKEYIGETSNLRARVRVHKQQTLDPRLRNLYVNHHIAHCSIGRPTLFKITPFFLVNRNDRTYRQEVEQYFIRKFKPELNREKERNEYEAQ